MKISIFLNLVLACALVALSIYTARLSNGSATTDKTEQPVEQTSGETDTIDNPVLANIMTRSSVRSYTDEAVSEADEEALLRAASAAPTAMDKRPWHFVTIKDRKLLDTLAEEFQTAKMLKEAPLAIVVCGDMNKTIEGDGRDYWVQDCSAATENLLLAAHALDLGAVWCGVYPLAERVQTMQKTLSLPENLVPLNIVAIGHPSGEPKVKDKWNPDAVTNK